MSSRVYDFIIVGAGIAGLHLAREIQKWKSDCDILILEKSKGCGGRMATRRVQDQRFDHGAQFIYETQTSQDLIHFWQKSQVIQDFSFSSRKAYCGVQGMTSLAKKMAEQVPVSYNSKLVKLLRHEKHFELACEDESRYLARQIIMTAPLPQSLDILADSGIKFDPNLRSITYSMAIILMTEFERNLDLPSHYVEYQQQDIFSICAQSAKHLSPKFSYTICMSEAWSHKHFHLNETEITDLAKSFLLQKYQTQNLTLLQVKKWRYCKPLQTWPSLYDSPEQGLFLIGDAFGGASLNGSLESSKAVFKYLQNQSKNI